MAGRKPVPTEIKLVTGRPGRVKPRNDEPLPVGELEAAPEWMSETQKLGWKYALEHAPKGLLKKLDRSILAIWVIAEDLHREAAQKIAQFGILTKSPVVNVPMQSLYLPVLNKQAQIMLKAASELGFTPTSRTRIGIMPAERPSSTPAPASASKYFKNAG